MQYIRFLSLQKKCPAVSTDFTIYTEFMTLDNILLTAKLKLYNYSEQ